MAAPVAKSASVELWDRLLDVAEDDVVGLERLIFQLRGLVARRPNDLCARMGLAFGLLLRGDRTEAMPHVDAACRLADSAPVDDRLNLSSLLTDCGRFGDARDVLETITRRRPGMDILELSGVAYRLALASGDLNLLEVIEPPDPACKADTLAFSAQIDGLGLGAALREHQAIVFDAVRTHCCFVEARIVADPEDSLLMLGVDIFTDLPAGDQFRLYDAIVERETKNCLAVAPYVGIGIFGPKVMSLSEDAA